MGQCPSAPRRRKPPPPPPSPSLALPSPPQQLLASIAEAAGEDRTAELPEDLLALVFDLLGSGDRKRCSLVCRRWLAAEAASRLRLALDARAPLLADSALPRLLARFPAVSKLAYATARLGGGRCEAFWVEGVRDDSFVFFLTSAAPALKSLHLISCNMSTTHGLISSCHSTPAPPATSLTPPPPRRFQSATTATTPSRRRTKEQRMDPGIGLGATTTSAMTAARL